MNKIRIACSALAILFGAFLFVYGELDDSPGGQLVGFVAVIFGIVGVIKSKKKSDSLAGLTNIAIIAIAVLAMGGFIGYYMFQKSPERQVACTADAMMCPDGSYVGRTGPNCEFKPCPEI